MSDQAKASDEILKIAVKQAWMSTEIRKPGNKPLSQHRYNINRSEAELGVANYRTSDTGEDGSNQSW